MRLAFADTSAFIALHDSGDAEHARAVGALGDILDSGMRLLTTNFVLDESITWFRQDADARERVGRAILESAFVENVRQACTFDDDFRRYGRFQVIPQ